MSRAVRQLVLSLAASFVSSGCLVRYYVEVPVSTVREAAPALKQSGQAEVSAQVTQGGEAHRHKRTQRETLRLDQRLRIADDTWTVQELLEGCYQDKASTEVCKLDDMAGFNFEVRDYQRRQYPSLLWTSLGVAGLALTGTAVYCAVECKDGSGAEVGSKIGLGALGVAALVGFIVCVRNGTCHD